MTDRLPPNQVLTTKWPVIGEREPEPFDPRTWRLAVTGRVRYPLSIPFDGLLEMPREEISGTIHCVTRWSRPRCAFRGVSVGALLREAGVMPDAMFVRFASGRGHDTSLPTDVAATEALVAFEQSLDGAPFGPIDPSRGGPVRTIVLARYFYKSVKWVRSIEAMADDRLGSWERNAGYHNNADPWREERYVAPGLSRDEVGAMVASRDFSGRDLRSADLSGADLSGANLARASLRNARLRGTILRGADLRGANVTNADLTGADLRDARIDDLDMDGADLTAADLRGATGTPSSLAVTQFAAPDGTRPARMDGVRWPAARLDGLLDHEEARLRAWGVL
ncbi:MAG: Sulfoxide reductase catalytic subunit YedY [Planctomycetes bacterium]|nr:Sulfoxide reductase catalytic subunit YedY [Planctomycetota bacterium]